MNPFRRSQPQQNYDCTEKMKKIWSEMPLFIKIVISTTIILYILNLFTQLVAFYLSNIPYYTLLKFQIWRLITTVFMSTSIFNIIFALISWVRDAMSLEIAMGTIKYMIIFMINSILIEVIYCAILGFLGLLFQNSKFLLLGKDPTYIQNSGLWPVIICEMTLLCMSNPENQMSFLFFPCQIRAKFYPLVLFTFFTLLNQFMIDFEVLSGIIYGFLYHFYLNNYLQISNNFIQKLETSFMFRWMMNFKGFVSVNYISSGSSGVVAISSSMNNSPGKENNDQTTQGFESFKGRGIAVGGSFNRGNGYDEVSQSSDTTKESVDNKI